MNRLFALAFTFVAIGCASTGQEPTSTTTPTATAQPQSAVTSLDVYAGTYELQGGRGPLEVRVWVGEDEKLHGELVASGRQTTFRATSEPHKFLHESSDEVSFQFTVENGRATWLTMRQRDREASGPRKD